MPKLRVTMKIKDAFGARGLALEDRFFHNVDQALVELMHVQRSTEVAKCTGGLLGIRRISAAEREVLARVESALSV